MLTLGRRRRLLATLAILAASTFFVTSIEAQIVHQHHSLVGEATCPLCHLLHRTAVQGVTGQIVSNPQPLCLKKVLPRNSSVRLSPFYTPNSPRAPPAA